MYTYTETKVFLLLVCNMVSRNAVVIYGNLFLPYDLLHLKQSILQFVHANCTTFTFAFQPPEAETDRLELAAMYYEDNLYHTNLLFSFHR